MAANDMELQQINYDTLLKQGFAIIDVRYKEYEITNEQFKYVITRIEGDRDDFYPSMLKYYLGKDLKDRNIYELWSKILRHKIAMSEILNRDVSIKVAALDFIENENA